MFDVYCEGHGARVLLGTGRIATIDNGADGIAVAFRCYCGHAGVWHTGRVAASAHAAAAAA